MHLLLALQEWDWQSCILWHIAISAHFMARYFLYRNFFADLLHCIIIIIIARIEVKYGDRVAVIDNRVYNMVRHVSL